MTTIQFPIYNPLHDFVLQMLINSIIPTLKKDQKCRSNEKCKNQKTNLKMKTKTKHHFVFEIFVSNCTYINNKVEPQIKRKIRGKNNKHDIIKLKEKKRKTSNIKKIKSLKIHFP